MKNSTYIWNLFKLEFFRKLRNRLFSNNTGGGKVITDNNQRLSKTATSIKNYKSHEDEVDHEIELMDIEPRKRINPEDRKKLQHVLEVINKHLPDRMLTTNPLKNELDLRIRENQTQAIKQKNPIYEKVV